MIISLVFQLLSQWTGGSVAHAESVSVPIQYDNVKRLSDGSFSASSAGKGQISYTPKSGYKVKQAYYKDPKTGSNVQLSLSDSGTTSIKIQGVPIKVTSKSNDNLTYYAWDRYSGSASKVWKATLGGQTVTAPISSETSILKPVGTVSYSTVDGYRVPDYPGVIGKGLEFPNRISEKYEVDDGQNVGKGTVIDPSVVATPIESDIDANPDYYRELKLIINGVYEIKQYMNVPQSKILNQRIIPQSSTLFKIAFDLQMDFQDFYRPLGAPGAASLYYILGYNTTVKSVTYRYPYDVTVEIVKKDTETTPPITSPPVTGSTPTPQPAGIIGDFDILPGNSITYRDSVSLQPKDIKTTGNCTYRYHEFKMANGATWASPRQTDKTKRIDFTYPDYYPAAISAGTVQVQMKVYGTQCSSEWVTKSFTVKAPAENHPPYFRLGWFRDGDFTSVKPLTQVVEGTKVMVRPIDDQTSNPVSPSDPDGDPFSLTGWDFSRSSKWVASLPDLYGYHPLADYLDRIDTTSVGYQTVFATMTDSFGAAYTAGATLEVIPKNPIPIIEGPTVVKENRPIADVAFSSAKSYSPVGRKIDHSKDEWTNKQTVYINGTDHDIQVTVKLDVWDEGMPALKSLAPATHTLTVQPDLPPIGKLDVAPLTLRGLPVTIYNKSYSPDGDPLVVAYYWYKYDANNNGFDDDGWQPLSGTMEKATFSPTKVGKYLFRVRSDEELKQGSYGEGQLDTINQAPTVSFVVEGKNEQPVPPDKKEYAANTILSKWSLIQTNTNAPTLTNGWYSSGSQLEGGSGKGIERQYAYSYEKTFGSFTSIYAWFSDFQNAGFGNNSINPYRTMTSMDTNKSQPLLVPSDDGTQLYPVIFNEGSSVAFKTTRERMYFAYNNNVYAMNKLRIPDFKMDVEVYAGGNATKSKPTWLGPSPYDFIITPPDYVKDSSGEFVFPEKIEDVKFELSGPTIYQGIVWKIRKNGSMSYVLDIRTYDAETGNFIASTFEKGITLDPTYWHRLIGYNGNLKVIYPTWPGINVSSTIYKSVTLDRNCNTTQPVSLPSIEGYSATNDNGDMVYYSYDNGGDSFYLGPDGEIYFYTVGFKSYRYNGQIGTPDPYTTYVSRVNWDNTLEWRVQLPGEYPTFGYSYAASGSSPVEGTWTISMNTVKRELTVRSFTRSWMDHIEFDEVINMDTGHKSISPRSVTAYPANYRIEPDGSYRDGVGGQPNSDGRNTLGGVVRDADGNALTGNLAGGGILSYQYVGMGYSSSTKNHIYSQFVGDGLMLSFFTLIDTLNPERPSFVPWLTAGPPTTNPLTFRGFSLGQFMSNVSERDTEFTFKLTMNEAQKYQDDLAGFSFRMQDGKNRYAVETNGTTLYLAKYVNGTRSVLASRAYPFQDKEQYSFKVKALGSALTVSVNGVQNLSVTDSTFSAGKFGPFTDKEHVTFGSVSTLEVNEPDIDWFSGYAIWEPTTGKAEARYSSILYSDPENDPKSGDSKWSYQHTPRFLNNQGLSDMNGKTFTGPQLSFDKVGDYLVTLRDRDDPNPEYLYPNMRFDEYRMDSNAYQVKVTVHRRPVAEFNLTANPDGTISWTDTSYDPDRWISDSNYSTEATGIDYRATRGIMERKYSYTSPSGVQGTEQLVRPTEKGVYSVTLQVRDEYGAWSEPVTKEIGTAVIPPANIRPTVHLTYPSGSKASPSFTTSTRPTVSWNQWDDSGWIRGYQVKVSSESGSVISESGEVGIATTAGSWSWQTGTLPRGQKLQVQVRVTDGEAWSDWSNIGWIQVNQAPTVTLTNPVGTKENPQKILDELRPTIDWTAGDPDSSFGARIKAYRVLIQRANGDVAYDSGTKSGDWALGGQSMKVPLDLPTNIPLKVMVRVYDGDLWSEWSNEEWLFINRRPTAIITYPSGTQSTPTIVARYPSIVFTQSDPDPGAVFPLFRVEVFNLGNTKVYDSGNLAGEEGSETWTERAHELTKALTPGEVYKVHVRVFDGYDWGDDSPFTYMRVNRAPSATLTIPAPIYEQDTPTFSLTVSDPDGDDLQVRVDAVVNGERVEVASWLLVSSGTTKTFTYGPLEKGMHSLSITVIDPFEETFAQTWSFPVLPLTIAGEIRHTPEWNEIRLRWNEKHPLETRAENVFWAGEALVLNATVTDTHTDTRPVRVTAKLLTNRLSLPLTGSDSIHFTGILNRPELAKLEDGEHTVRFTAVWSNGAVSTADVPFVVAGSMYKVVVNQTRH